MCSSDLVQIVRRLSVLVNQASNYLNGGVAPRPLGNQHPNVVPYQDFRTRDGQVLVALGNDRQFRDFCGVIRRPDLSADPRFADIPGRSRHRDDLVEEIAWSLAKWSTDELVLAMEKAKLPGGPINRIDQALEDPHVKARGLVRTLARPDGTPVNFLGFPAILSRTPATYRTAPPRLGADTKSTLDAELGIDAATFDELCKAEVVGS